MNIKIIYEDDYLLVIDKPSGMTVNRSDTTKEEETVQDWAERYLKIPNPKSQIPNKLQNLNDKSKLGFDALNLEFTSRAGIVHRLDKETSGILLVAKTPEIFADLQRQFKERKVEKTYIALVHGKVVPEEGEVNVPVGRLSFNRKRFGVVAGGREAVTKYKALRYLEVRNGRWDTESLTSKNRDIKKSNSRTSYFTLLELYPKTGRTHQIRVHLKYISHPIFADPLYAGRKVGRDDRKSLNRLFLHAAEISFCHPFTNKLISLRSPLPKDLNNFLSTLPEVSI